MTVPEDGVFQLQAATVLETRSALGRLPVEVRVGTQGPRVIGVEPANLAYSRAGRTVPCSSILGSRLMKHGEKRCLRADQ